MTGTPQAGHRFLLEALACLVPLVAVVAACRNPITFADLGWQLQLGRLMARAGPFVHEQFLAGHQGEALLPNAWLAQIVYARLLDWTGWAGLRAVDALLWASGPLLAVLPARLRRERLLPIVIAIGIGLAVALPAASVRPQSFASLGFGLTLVLVQQVRSWRMALLYGVPLFVVWQNLHPSVPIAVLVLGAIAAVQWGQYLAGRAQRPVAISVLALVAGAAVFATPAGWGIVAFARYNTAASVAFGATEWFPLWNPYHRMIFLSVLLWGGVVLALAAGRKLSVREWVPVLVTFVLAMTAARFVLFYAIAIVPALTRLEVGEVRAAGRIATGYAVSALAIVAACLCVPWMSARGPDQQLAQVLVTRLHQGTVFSDTTLGGAIVLEGYPNWRVSFDGRYFLFHPEEIALLVRTATDAGTQAEIERIYHPAAYALKPGRSLALVQALAAQPQRWDLVYHDSANLLFVRR